MRLYIKKIGIEDIEKNINVDTIPQLITIQKVFSINYNILVILGPTSTNKAVEKCSLHAS